MQNNNREAKTVKKTKNKEIASKLNKIKSILIELRFRDGYNFEEIRKILEEDFKIIVDSDQIKSFFSNIQARVSYGPR